MFEKSFPRKEGRRDVHEMADNFTISGNFCRLWHRNSVSPLADPSEKVSLLFRCRTTDRLFLRREFLYHLSRLSAAVSSDQQPCDAAPRNCRAIPFYLDLEKKKTDPGSNGEPAGADRTIA